MFSDDDIRLRPMLDAARDAMEFAHGQTRVSLEHDRMLALALLKCIEIIGEAAARISPEGRTAYPQIAWPQIIAMRNRLVHGYFDIDLNRVWDTVIADLPPLIAELERMLS